MSEYKIGDRLEVTVRGTVAYTSSFEPYFHLEDEDGRFIAGVSAGKDVTVKRLASPLPTAPGSVVRGRYSLATYLLRHDGSWISQNGLSSSTLSPISFEVIYDAGEVS